MNPPKALFWLTIPNVRERSSRRWFPLTVVLSILWIGVVSILMVDATAKIGACLNISQEILGITLLAMGSSVPDMVASLVVARADKATMAVSNSFGSNVFNTCVCLGLPWLIQTLKEDAPVHVNTDGLMPLTGYLLAMTGVFLLGLIGTRFNMGKRSGGFLVVLYAGFVVLAVVLAKRQK